MPRARFVWNPVSRRLHPDRLQEAAQLVRGAGWEVEIKRTAGVMHAVDLAREAAAAGIDAVAACGGDGTVNEVVNGLAGSATALAVLPGGTANVWAKEVGIPLNPLRAARLLIDGDRRPVDVGRAGERRFLLMAGVGFDAHIVGQVGRDLKRWLGAASYVAQGGRELFGYRGAVETLRLDGRALESPVFWLVLGNTRSYGGAIRITNRSLVDDGLLDLCVFQDPGPLRLGLYGIRMLAGLQRLSHRVIWERLRTLEIDGPPLPVQVDGEAAGMTPMRFQVEPGALRAIVPRNCRSPLFAN